jgi:peptidoglycan/xylan/chitin deacetylase (PgdA/CDA1 family)
MDLRLDRLATLYLVSPLMRSTSERELYVPMLMYHSISGEDESGLRAYFRTCTSPDVFAEQMACLHSRGFQTCSPAQTVSQLQSGISAMPKPVAITFDDGYADFYRHAFPVLSRYNFSATVFLPTAYIGDTALQFKNRDCLTWDEVRELSKYGVRFGSHTVTHPRLRDLSPRVINEEIVCSKQAIEQKIGCAVDSFAYPYAFPQEDTEFKMLVRELLYSAGYTTGVCTALGRASRNSDRLFLERLPVNSADDAALFEAKLLGAYDWIATPQRLVKIAKSQAARFRRKG